jgi:hypothetical protein
MFGGVTVVQAEWTGSSQMACRTVAAGAGNSTVELSVNGQDWSSSSMSVELISVANVSMVTPALVSTGASSLVSVHGSGLVVASGVARTYCAVGGSMVVQSTWGYSEASMVSSSSVECRVSGRASGMQVLELSLGEGGVISYS